MSTLYEILRRPLITEKSNYPSGKLNQYAFEVDKKATRTQVKDAIETIFDVKVERVNIINSPAKRGRKARSRGITIRKPGYKKALVTLKDGQTLQIFEGVQ